MLKTITLLNKLNRKDSQTGLDVWYKTILTANVYNQKVTSAVGMDVSMNETYTILIPFSDKYSTYHLWKSMNKDEHYTLKQGDVIIFDEVEEEVTTNNIAEIQKQYESCVVRTIEQREKILDANYQFKVGAV